MIKKFIDKLLGKSASATHKSRFGKRQEVGPEEHGIDPALVDERALNVVRTLKQGGFQAYVVGGAVRDLLVGLRPKDFDVPPTPRPSRSRACSGAPSSSAGASASCMWCTAAAASTR